MLLYDTVWWVPAQYTLLCYINEWLWQLSSFLYSSPDKREWRRLDAGLHVEPHQHDPSWGSRHSSSASRRLRLHSHRHGSPALRPLGRQRAPLPAPLLQTGADYINAHVCSDWLMWGHVSVSLWIFYRYVNMKVNCRLSKLLRGGPRSTSTAQQQSRSWFKDISEGQLLSLTEELAPLWLKDSICVLCVCWVWMCGSECLLECVCTHISLHVCLEIWCEHDYV